MLQSLFTPPNRTRTLLFLGLCLGLAVAAALVGIDDNPPGLIMAALSGLSLVLAFTHAWRSASRFQRLIRLAVVVFILSLALGIGLQILVESTGMTGLGGQISGIYRYRPAVGCAFPVPSRPAGGDGRHLHPAKQGRAAIAAPF